MNEKIEGGLRKRGVRKATSPGRPLISVVVAVLNRVEFIEGFIRSVREQAYSNIELVIIDGGSNDATLDILRHYDHIIDYWLSEEDAGIYDALNKGIAVAAGDWINIQGSDDRLLASFSLIVPHLIDSETVYCGDLRLLKSGKIFKGNLTAYGLMNLRLPHHGLLFPRQLFEQYRYDPEYSIAADNVMIAQVFAERRYRFVHLPIVVAVFDDIHGISSVAYDQKFMRERLMIWWKLFPCHLFMLVLLKLLLIHICMVLKVDLPLKLFMNRMLNCNFDLRTTCGFRAVVYAHPDDRLFFESPQ